MIVAAAEGNPREREAFARCYLGSIRAYLIARWRATLYFEYVDDAVQDVFMECFQSGNPLARVDQSKSRGFRPFLYGIVRNVARRFESRINSETQQRTHGHIDVDAIPVDDSQLSQIFEREWARSIMRQAAEQQRTRAEQLGDAALARVELLRLRFEEELPIREIAKLWQVDAPVLHREYAKARQEFKDSLRQVVAFHFTGSHVDLQREIAAILAALR